MDALKCDRCGKSGHDAAKCDADAPKCVRCGRIGHKAAKCTVLSFFKASEDSDKYQKWIERSKPYLEGLLRRAKNGEDISKELQRSDWAARYFRAQDVDWDAEYAMWLKKSQGFLNQLIRRFQSKEDISQHLENKWVARYFEENVDDDSEEKPKLAAVSISSRQRPAIFRVHCTSCGFQVNSPKTLDCPRCHLAVPGECVKDCHWCWKCSKQCIHCASYVRRQDERKRLTDERERLAEKARKERDLEEEEGGEEAREVRERQSEEARKARERQAEEARKWRERQQEARKVMLAKKATRTKIERLAKDKATELGLDRYVPGLSLEDAAASKSRNARRRAAKQMPVAVVSDAQPTAVQNEIPCDSEFTFDDDESTLATETDAEAQSTPEWTTALCRTSLRAEKQKARTSQEEASLDGESTHPSEADVVQVQPSFATRARIVAQELNMSTEGLDWPTVLCGACKALGVNPDGLSLVQQVDACISELS